MSGVRDQKGGFGFEEFSELLVDSLNACLAVVQGVSLSFSLHLFMYNYLYMQIEIIILCLVLKHKENSIFFFFCLKSGDNTPPSLTCPPNIQKTAVKLQTWQIVSWAEPTANDGRDGGITLVLILH